MEKEKLNLQKTAVISIDTDWIPAQILDVILDTLLTNIPATFFVTGEYKSLNQSQFEINPHPNPTSLNDSDLKSELYEKLNYCSNAIGYRGHSLIFSERFRPVFRQAGIKYSSSAMMYLQPNIHPYPLGYDLIELPIFFMDYHHMEVSELSNRNPFDIDSLNISQQGLKIFLFHPIHLALNTPNLQQYQKNKKYYHQPQEIMNRTYSGDGMRSFYKNIIHELLEHNYSFSTLGEVYNSLMVDESP